MSKKKQQPSRMKVLLGIVAFILLAGLILVSFLLDRRPEQPVQTETEPPATQKYVLRKDIETYLILGLDKFEAPVDAMGYINDQQNDFLLLMIVDRADGTCEFLHLNRDTMTQIHRLGVGGGDAGKFEGQLALAHTFGSGGSDSCINTVKAVSGLLKGARIDHYLTVTMDAVPKINDLLGGVEVEIPVDMTSVDPAFRKGETVRLQGEQALKFVRSRSSLEDSSNLSRMERQRAFLTSLFDAMTQKLQEDPEFLNDSLLELSSSFQSDLSINRLDALGQELKDMELKPFLSIGGEAKKGETYMEYYLDEESLNQVLLKLFYEAGEN